MREILFRGKLKSNREWIEGSAINTQYDVKGNKHIYIGVFKTSLRYPLMKFIEWFEVVPETVGQYTGLTDKNGTKIFEGDIIRYSIYPPDKYEYGVVNWLNGGFRAGEDSCNLCVCSADGVATCKLEVIGNIHDNPELLKGVTADA